jgi:hypothetical protein
MTNHSNQQVTDARATMAVFRIHRKEWEKETNHSIYREPGKFKKRKRNERGNEDEEGDANGGTIGGGRKGVSSGLSTVVKRARSGGGAKERWWDVLGESSSKGPMTRGESSSNGPTAWDEPSSTGWDEPLSNDWDAPSSNVWDEPLSNDWDPPSKGPMTWDDEPERQSDNDWAVRLVF